MLNYPPKTVVSAGSIDKFNKWLNRYLEGHNMQEYVYLYTKEIICPQKLIEMDLRLFLPYLRRHRLFPVATTIYSEQYWKQSRGV